MISLEIARLQAARVDQRLAPVCLRYWPIDLLQVFGDTHGSGGPSRWALKRLLPCGPTAKSAFFVDGPELAIAVALALAVFALGHLIQQRAAFAPERKSSRR
jgi:hypothetical protein